MGCMDGGVEVFYLNNEGKSSPRGLEDVGTTGTADRKEPTNQHKISKSS